MIKELYRRGVSISEIARVTGHDRKTIRGVVQGPVMAAPQVRKARASKLDPFVPYLERRSGANKGLRDHCLAAPSPADRAVWVDPKAKTHGEAQLATDYRGHRAR
jgi:hypothetical protein